MGTRFFLAVLFVALLSGLNKAESQTSSKVAVVGAGFGGLYAAFRLQNDTTSGYLPEDVFLFQDEAEAGGRAKSEHVFPTRHRVSVGAHRWDPDSHVIVDTVIKTVLNLTTRCYFQDQTAATPCSDNGNSYFWLRNTYNGDLSKAAGLPYYLNKNEKWNKKMGMKDVVGIIESFYPFLSAAIEDISSPDPSIRYPAMKTALDTLRFFSVDGALPNQLTIRTALNQSSEFWKLLISSWGEAIYILDFNVYNLIRDDLTLGYTAGTLEEIVDSEGYELGYQFKDLALASLLSARGVSMNYNKRLASLKRAPNGDLVLGFADGSTHTAQKVILNIAITQLLQLSADSVVFTEVSTEVRKMYDLIIPAPAAKIYGYYDHAWWHPMFDQGYVATDTTANYYDFRDSFIEDCHSSSCKGVFNMAYPDGENYKYFRTVKTDSVTYINANTTNARLGKWFWDFNSQFVNSFCNATKQVNCNIPAPSIIAMGIWDAAWHDFLPNDYPGGTISNATSVLAEGVYWANEANSYMQGWAEGSVLLSERVLHNEFGLSRPNWLGNDYWYEALVTNPLI